MRMMPRSLMLVAAAAGLAMAPAALAAPVDLSTWTAEGVGSFNWVLQNPPANDAVLQTVNGDPTVFFGPGNAQGLALSGQITVTTTSDDDFIGFVLGYHSGDLTNLAADYILIDWKQANQNFFGCLGAVGLAISRVTGPLGNNSGPWCHAPANNVTELARANTLGGTGWGNNQTNEFDISFTASNITVLVNGVEEFNLDGTFANGSFGFYNYSQAQVLYAAIEETELPPDETVPEPGSFLVLAAGLLGLGYVRRRTA